MRHKEPQRGRGAVSNPTGRFEPCSRYPFDDGWGAEDEAPPRLETRITHERTLQIITENDSPDVPFSRSINPYKGCEHGCAYCFARPSHAYLGLSSGLDFESRIVAKPEAPKRLREALAKPSYRPQPIALGANTDPYQQAERQERITRGILEVLRDFRHPVSIVTKSNMVLRDLDILADMAKERLASVMFSVTTLDRRLARIMEPRAATPEKRLEAMRQLDRAGVPVGVLASPMIPAVNDAELERILEAAKEAGARSAGTIVLRLPHELRELFSEWLRAHFPERAEHALSILRAAHGGRLYDAKFGERMTGSGDWADLLQKRFALACRRLDLDGGHIELDSEKFRVPGGQMSLF